MQQVNQQTVTSNPIKRIVNTAWLYTVFVIRMVLPSLWILILSYIPGNANFNREYSRSIVKRSRRILKAIKSNENIDAIIYKNMYRKLRYAIIQISKTKETMFRVQIFFFLILLIPTFVTYLYIVTFIYTGSTDFIAKSNFFQILIQFFSIDSFVFITMSVSLFVFVITPLVILWRLEIPFSLSLLIFAILHPLYIYFIYYTYTHDISLLTRLEIRALQGGLVFYLLHLLYSITVLAPSIVILDYLSDKYMMRYNTQAFLVNSLCENIILLESNPERWPDMQFKKKVIGNIERCAYIIQFAVPKAIGSIDPITSLWFNETTEQVANFLRSLKKWVLIPRSDTRELLINNITVMLIHIVVGSWDELERQQTEKLSKPARWNGYLQGFLRFWRSIFIAFLPIVILLVMERTQLLMPGVVTEYARVGVFLWTVIALLAALDPLYGEKISAIKTIGDLLPLPHKQKDS